MINEKAIIIKGLSKAYYKKDSSHTGFFDKLNPNKSGQSFFALKDINLEINKGEVIGIIGPNGAGKSTLLKILAEVTPPTVGSVEIFGKVASILEIGIGFQPELSGYENIFLSGKLYGLSKKQILSKLDKIIEMFGFPDFINTPVKYFSSGMYMRLAFAVITNIEADIYLLDEVLSVGDAGFRDKVLNMISTMANNGKTVLIVTHTPDTIYAYCNKISILNNGNLIEFDEPGKCIAKYNSLAFHNSGKTIKTKNSNPEESLVTINSDFQSFFKLNEVNIDISGDIVSFKINFEVLKKNKVQIRIIIKDELNKPTIEILPNYNTDTIGKFCQRTILPENLLNPFYYFIDFHIYINDKIAGVYSKIIKFRYKEELSQEKSCLFKLHNAKTEISPILD